MIPEEVKQKIKELNPIEEVVGKYVNFMKKSSNNLFGLCPFHQEKTPSFSVAPHKGIFYCFGCQKGGDVVEFIMQMENLSYQDAYKFLAQRVGRADLLVENSPAQSKQEEKRRRSIELNKFVARYYYDNLCGVKGKKAQRYLIDRKVRLETVRSFALGYASDQWQDLYEYMKQKLKGAFKPEELVELGLLKEKNGRYYDAFRHRLMFPIMNRYGQVIAFGGRKLEEEKTQEDYSNPKYLNSPDSHLYHKGEHLYGMHVARQSKESFYLLVEGYMDVLSCHAANIKEAVGVLGTALTKKQVKQLKNKEYVILSLDQDRAGKSATFRAIQLLAEEGLPCKILYMKEAKDPDEYISKRGGEAFQALMKQAKKPFQFFLDYYREQHTKENDLDRSAYAYAILQVIVDLSPNRMERSTYLHELSEQVKLPLVDLEKELLRLEENALQKRTREEEMTFSSSSFYGNRGGGQEARRANKPSESKDEHQGKTENFSSTEELSLAEQEEIREKQRLRELEEDFGQKAVHELSSYQKEELQVLHLFFLYPEHFLELPQSIQTQLRAEDFLSSAMIQYFKAVLRLAKKWSQEKQEKSTLYPANKKLFFTQEEIYELLRLASLFTFANGNLKEALLALQMEIARLKPDLSSVQMAVLRLKHKKLGQKMQELAMKGEENQKEELSLLFRKRAVIQQLLDQLTQM